nr:fibronectin type III domain-containing protein [Paenibacillus puerhi]
MSSVYGGPADTQKPSAPTNLVGASPSFSSVALSWNPSTDNVGVTGYNVYQDGSLAAISRGTAYTVTGLKGRTTYNFTVRAIDGAGNISDASNPVKITTLESFDKTPPTAPTGLKAVAAITTASLSWTASTDDVGVAGYHIYKDGVLAGSSTTTSYVVSGLEGNTTYAFTVKAFDDANNLSAPSNAATASTGDPANVQTIKPGIIADYTTWYVGINGADKPASGTVATLTRLASGGLDMKFNLQTENYPGFQVDPATPANWRSYNKMNIVITNPNAKEIQVQPIVKDGAWEWVELGPYIKIPAKTTVLAAVPLEGLANKEVNRMIFRVQSGSSGFAGSLQLHTIDFDLAADAYAAAIAEMNRPNKASYYPWNHVDSAFTGNVSSGLDGETIFVNYSSSISDTIAAGVATETKPGLGVGDDWTPYSSVSCTLTNTGTKAIHVSLVLRSGGGWVWQETGGQTDTDLTTERVLGPGESVDVTYAFHSPIWKSAATAWVNNAKVSGLSDIRGIAFKVYPGTGEQVSAGKLSITNFQLNF